MKSLFICATLVMSISTFAQDTAQLGDPFSISAYIEGFYNYDVNKPASNNRPGFLYSHNRHNEFNVNLAFIKGGYAAERIRANLAVAVGTYVNANYAAEPGVLKNVYEANAGYKLSGKKNIWFDIGIFPSHIGFETAVSKDDWALTRSLVAENSPYYESGARLTYGSDDGKLAISVLALNGWQRITRVEGNSLMSFGTQVFFKAGENVTLNYSTFFGTDKPDSARLKRSYHNVYGIFQFTEKIGFTAGFDIGLEDRSVSSSGNNKWYTPVGILRITPNDTWAFALRGEHYSDKKGVIIASGTPNGFQTTGLSANIDYMPTKNAAIRVEVRALKSKDRIFVDRYGTVSDNNTAITFSTALYY